MIEKALGKTSVTSVVADTAERAPKGSYKRNYASGFDGWIDEITLRKGSKPDEKAIEKIKSLVSQNLMEKIGSKEIHLKVLISGMQGS